MVKYTLKEKILKFLIEHKENHSIMEISKQLKIDYKNTFQAINNLNQKTYEKKKHGSSHLISFVSNNNSETISIENKRTEEFITKNPKLKIIKNYIEEINYPFMIVLVFGSYVKNTKTKISDVDICIISDNEEKKKKLFNRLNLLSLKLEIQEFTTGEFISMIEKRQRNLGHEIIKNNILLYGIENYYNLISKWMTTE